MSTPTELQEKVAIKTLEDVDVILDAIKRLTGMIEDGGDVHDPHDVQRAQAVQHLAAAYRELIGTNLTRQFSKP